MRQHHGPLLLSPFLWGRVYFLEKYSDYFPLPRSNYEQVVLIDKTIFRTVLRGHKAQSLVQWITATGTGAATHEFLLHISHQKVALGGTPHHRGWHTTSCACRLASTHAAYPLRSRGTAPHLHSPHSEQCTM